MNVIVCPNCICAGGCPICDGAGCGYTVVSGSGVTTGTSPIILFTASNALVRTNTFSDFSHVSESLSATFGLASSTGTVRMILKYLDADNYWAGEITFGGTHTIRIIQRVAGVDTTHVSKTGGTGTTAIARFCCSTTHFTLRVVDGSLNPTVVTYFTTVGAAQLAAFRAGTINADVSVTDIRYEYNFQSSDHEHCPACNPHCAPHCTDDAPRQIKMTITGVVNGGSLGGCSCTGLNGIYFLDFCGPDGYTITNTTAACTWKTPHFTGCGHSDFIAYLRISSGIEARFGRDTLGGCSINLLSFSWQKGSGPFVGYPACNSISESVPIPGGMAGSVNCNVESSTCFIEAI